MRKFRTYGEVDHTTGSELLEQVLDQRARLSERLAGIGTVVAVASGKGGVGKSAVTANLAVALAERGHSVGALDADLNGPSLARMLGVQGRRLEDREGGVIPPAGRGGVRVISMEWLQEGDDAPLRWRDGTADTFLWQSSRETTALREFLGDVDWGNADFLLIDVPPGTDKIRRLLELVPEIPLVLLVSTPSEMSRSVVARSARLLRESSTARIALVENMSGFICPECGHEHDVFPGDGVRQLAEASEIPIWARIPFDPTLGRQTDLGHPLGGGGADRPAYRAFRELAARVSEIGSAPSGDAP
jgi:ATP-binding protein involved in chromosome partitioning